MADVYIPSQVQVKSVSPMSSLKSFKRIPSHVSGVKEDIDG